MGKKGYRNQLVMLRSHPSSPKPSWKDPQDILKQGSSKKVRADEETLTVSVDQALA